MAMMIRQGDITGFDDAEVIDVEREDFVKNKIRKTKMLKEGSFYLYENGVNGLGLYEIILDEYGELVCRGDDFIPYDCGKKLLIRQGI